ncbi:MAG: molybdopterin-dependent oxidoreductase, partial [Spirochaetes bacterium]|nr:molybdopterin-dependent oxidoreductase [Spirochaetota bacterium]
MIEFVLNGYKHSYDGDPEISLLKYLRNIAKITSVKDGCSGQAYCNDCLTEINQKPQLSCITPLKKLNGAQITTVEGIPQKLRDIIVNAFLIEGAVQCGYCTPAMILRTKILLENNPDPAIVEIRKAFKNHLCRCTGYLAIIAAVKRAALALKKQKSISLPYSGKIGQSLPKYDAYEKAIGASPFVDDLSFEGLLAGALKFSDFPRARILSINIDEAKKYPGVVAVFTADDIPGERFNGLIIDDWPVMVAKGESTCYIGDVLAGVVAENEDSAREAVNLIQVEYEELPALTDMETAETSSIKVHSGGNLLDSCKIKRGKPVDEIFQQAPFVVEQKFETQRIEHAFLETEAAIALPYDEGIRIYSQSQGVYEDRKQIARILGLSIDQIQVILIPTGGGFGGKEDLTVQHHAALFTFLTNRPVKIHLNREESLIMHPKRHPFRMNYQLACDKKGNFQALRVKILGDSGAYASVGMKVLQRAAGHASGAYYIPNVDIEAKAVYTNNLPCGAMRGFGVNQVTFAMEGSIDQLCKKGKFDRFQIRYQNALDKGLC